MSERYIYLKNKGELVRQELFDCESQRLKIVEKWKKLYGKKFDELTITEDPKIEKVRRKKKTSGALTYGHILTTGKKSFKGFNKSWNGYKD